LLFAWLQIWGVIGLQRKNISKNEENADSTENEDNAETESKRVVTRTPYFYINILVLVVTCIIPIIISSLMHVEVSPFFPIISLAMTIILIVAFVFFHIHESYLIRHYRSNRPSETTNERRIKYRFHVIITFFTLLLFVHSFMLLGMNQKTPNAFILWSGIILFSLFSISSLYVATQIKACVENRKSD
jgi:membrane protein implicated in regulation of membrane protease activity